MASKKLRKAVRASKPDLYDAGRAVAFYWAVSLSLVFLNKSVLRGPAPLFATWVQLLFSIVLCYIFGHLSESGVKLLAFFPRFEFRLEKARQLLPLTLLLVGMLVCNNLCLKYVEVSFYQVARSWTIIFNIAVTWFMKGSLPSARVLTACGVIVIGFVLGVEGEINASWVGVAFGVASSGFVSTYSIATKKYLGVVDNNPWTLMMYTNGLGTLIMPLVFVAAGELPHIAQLPAFSDGSAFSVFFVTGICGFLINFASFAQINATSALTHNVSGTAKACAQTLIALAVYRNPISDRAGFGTVLCIAGSAWYSYLRTVERS